MKNYFLKEKQNNSKKKENYILKGIYLKARK